MIKMNEIQFKKDSSLNMIAKDKIKERLSMLLDFLKAWSRQISRIHISESSNIGILAKSVFKTKSLVFSHILEKLLNDKIEQLDTGSQPSVEVSRSKAMIFNDSGKVDVDGKYSIFGQIIQQLNS
jgi:hypothetical protein